jgi:ribosomal protein S27E
MEYEIKKDKYLKSRGGSAHFLIIRCANCGTDVLLYQKDGPGQLLRMYKDRIIAPEKLADDLKDITDKGKLPAIKCSECGAVLAMPMVYKPEDRLAFRVIHGTIHKIKSTGIWPRGGR